MAHVSHKLSNAIEGALAGGGDPATSPLYIFGPFLKLIVVAGVAEVTFGASLWLVVITIAMVSAMYRLVMAWVTDGSGGSGLSEEEFGSWAVKINAGITFVEYTLTFLVSMAALVTFIADRLPVLNETFLGLQYRVMVAVGLSILTGWLVNRGPKVAARAFGPATGAVLLLLWLMVIVTIWRFGLHLPKIDLAAFTGPYINFTFGGFARILAVMTGIEVFANLVAAYDGPPAEKSRKAFNSLLVIMGTTAITMVVVGPVIFRLSDPTNPDVSVFTQTMDRLLPSPLPFIGTLVGIAVLLSASAASAQGLQNLFVGLKYRHYIPDFMGEINKFGVADKPVWLEVGLASLCFIAFGTHEEIYLSIYAAGVFILLSMTGWAAGKRLIRQLRERFSFGKVVILLGTTLAALLTSGATVIIFGERFFEGAWTYLLFIPTLYIGFSYFRGQLGEPTAIEEKIGRLISTRSALAPQHVGSWLEKERPIKHVMVPLDGSLLAEMALPVAETLAQSFAAPLSLFSVTANLEDRYLERVATSRQGANLRIQTFTDNGPVADKIHMAVLDRQVDLIVMSTHGRSGVGRLILGSVAEQLVQRTARPILLVRAAADPVSSRFNKILVTLDGSERAEQVLPYTYTIARQFGSEVELLLVPQGSAHESQEKIQEYLEGVSAVFQNDGILARPTLTGSDPVSTIVDYGRQNKVDLIMIATHGRGGWQRLLLGSVADAVVRQANCSVFLVPIQDNMDS
ncbi:MAG: universal stress protein [Candidatus Promineifilaceae bacterium]